MTHPATAGGCRERLLSSVVLLCALWSCAASLSVQAGDLLSEESVKAAYVLRFAGYVEWPADQPATANFTIAVLGASEVGLRLQAVAAGRSMLNRPVQVRRIASMQDARDAQILYVGTDRLGDLRKTLSAVAGRNILIITEEEGALASGSMINFLTVDKRVRFEVSLEAARRARLRISSGLLSVAVRVQQ